MMTSSTVCSMCFCYFSCQPLAQGKEQVYGEIVPRVKFLGSWVMSHKFYNQLHYIIIITCRLFHWRSDAGVWEYSEYRFPCKALYMEEARLLCSLLVFAFPYFSASQPLQAPLWFAFDCTKVTPPKSIPQRLPPVSLVLKFTKELLARSDDPKKKLKKTKFSGS